MKFSKCLLVAAFWAAFFMPANAQWQGPTNAVPYGQGAGVSGFGFAGPGTNNQAFMGNTGVAPGFRALVGSDLPLPSTSTLGGVKAIGILAHNWVTNIDSTGQPGQAQPGFSDLSGNINVNQMNSGTGASSSTFWRGDGTWAAAGTPLGIFNVKSSPYNAKCDGSTDDSTALQSAFNAAKAVGGTVYVPTGTCVFATGLLLQDSGSQITMRLTGDGYGSILSYSGTGTAIAVTGLAQNRIIFKLDNIQIAQSNSASTGVAVTNANLATFDYCKITGGTKNITFTTSFSSKVEKCFLGGTQGSSITYANDGSTGAAVVRDNGIFSTSAVAGSAAVLVDGGGGGMDIAGNDLEVGYLGIQFQHGSTAINFRGNHVEQMTAGAFFFGTGGANNVDITANNLGCNSIVGVNNVAGTQINVAYNQISGCQITWAAGMTDVTVGPNTFSNSASIAEAPYTALTLSGGWTQSGTTGFKKLANGDVVIRGALTAGAGAAFTLPAGYRPGATYTGVVENSAGSGSMFVQITTAGVATPSANVNVTLDGLRFPAGN